jgi:hypothetical protein
VQTTAVANDNSFVLTDDATASWKKTAILATVWITSVILQSRSVT